MDSCGDLIQFRRRPGILVAGDVPLVIALVSATLQLAGYGVTASRSCTGVLEQLARARPAPSLICVDATRHPFAAAATIRRLREIGCRIPIVALVPPEPAARSIFDALDVQAIVDSVWDGRSLRDAVEDALDRVGRAPQTQERSAHPHGGVQ
jgi:CheY-like chemotaxis protein